MRVLPSLVQVRVMRHLSKVLATLEYHAEVMSVCRHGLFVLRNLAFHADNRVSTPYWPRPVQGLFFCSLTRAHSGHYIAAAAQHSCFPDQVYGASQRACNNCAVWCPLRGLVYPPVWFLSLDLWSLSLPCALWVFCGRPCSWAPCQLLRRFLRGTGRMW